MRRSFTYAKISSSSDHREDVVFEVKGYKSSSTIRLGTRDKKNTVSWFFRRTLPFAGRALRGLASRYMLKACYLTTAEFEPDAIKFLESMNRSKHKPVDLDVWYDGARLMRLLKAKGMTQVAKVVKRYYLTGQGTAKRDSSAHIAQPPRREVRTDASGADSRAGGAVS